MQCSITHSVRRKWWNSSGSTSAQHRRRSQDWTNKVNRCWPPVWSHCGLSTTRRLMAAQGSRLSILMSGRFVSRRRSRSVAKGKRKAEPERLKGWQEIARFLGQPISVAQRWAKSGMPISREERRVNASVEELTRWLGRESAGEPVQIASENTDLSSEL